MEEFLPKRKAAFFKNLVLLGLDETFEKKHGISFNKDMFDKPNKKGFEIVTHFLFSKLTAATGKDYNIPWPLLCKEHERDFRKTCHSHLMNFSRENCVKFPHITPSLLSTSGGFRFYNVYLAFSCYVLEKTIRKNENVSLLSRPVVRKVNFSSAKDILQLSTILHMKKFNYGQMMMLCNHCIWFPFAKLMEHHLRKLKHLFKKNKYLLKKEGKVIASLYSIPERNCTLREFIEKTMEYMKPVKKQRKNLGQFFTTEEKFWQYLASEVEDKIENNILNGKDYNISVNEDLPEEYRKELEKLGYFSSEEDGKLSVMRFIKLSMVYLSYIIDLLEKADLNDFHVESFGKDATFIEADLSSVETLNKKFSEEMIPNVEQSIKKLKVINSFDDVQENVELSYNELCSVLPVPSFNFEEVKKRVSHFNPSIENLCHFSASEKLLYRKEFDNEVALLENFSLELSLIDEKTPTGDSSFLYSDDLDRTLTPSDPCTSHIMNEKDNYSQEIHSREDATLKDLLPSSNLSISMLDDIDFEPSTHFEMRGSWLLEESLNSVTLPDMSFDE